MFGLAFNYTIHVTLLLVSSKRYLITEYRTRWNLVTVVKPIRANPEFVHKVPIQDLL